MDQEKNDNNYEHWNIEEANVISKHSKEELDKFYRFIFYGALGFILFIIIIAKLGCTTDDKKQNNEEQFSMVNSNVTCEYVYSEWSDCNSEGYQTRKVLKKNPAGCVSGVSKLERKCDYVSNPAYLKNPDSFLVDKDRVISELPDNFKSVWVENVVDYNTIEVSYIIVKAGENIITFATIELYGIASLDSCIKKQSLEFLKSLIEKRYIVIEKIQKIDYVSQNDANNLCFVEASCSHINKHIIAKVFINKNDFGDNIELLKKYLPYIDNNDYIDFNKMMVILGYAEVIDLLKTPIRFKEDFKPENYAYYSKSINFPFTEYIKTLKEYYKVAKLAKRGALDICGK